MIFSRETDERINTLFKTNEEMRKRLFACDANAIREIGFLAQTKVDPEDVIDAIESNDPDTLNYLLNKAKKLVELKTLYKDMCNEFYKKMKIPTETEEQTQDIRRRA